ncbi:hypothetical protein BDV93DRAFT_542464, partial [Ceratobasidium sp. AG-I]
MDFSTGVYAQLYEVFITIGLLVIFMVFTVRIWDSSPSLIPADLIARIPITLHRGVNQAVLSTPVRHLFHPHPLAQFGHENDALLNLVIRLVDEFIIPAMKSITSTTILVSFVDTLQSFSPVSRIEAYATLLRTHLSHGVVELSTIRTAYISEIIDHGVTCQYPRLASFMLGILVGLIFVPGMPAGTSACFCVGGLLLLGLHGIGVSELAEGSEEEGDDVLLDLEVNPINDTDTVPVAEL